VNFSLSLNLTLNAIHIQMVARFIYIYSARIELIPAPSRLLSHVLYRRLTRLITGNYPLKSYLRRLHKFIL